MSEAAKTGEVVPKETNLPEKPRRGFFREVFGQLLTLDFWKELGRALVNQAVASFLMGFGEAFYKFGKDKRNKDMTISDLDQSYSASRAFGGNNTVTPSPSFNSSGGYPSTHIGPPSDTFPGFRR